VRGVEPGAEWNEYRRRGLAGLRGADEVVAPTAAILRAIGAAHHLLIGGRVIPNGRAGAAWRPADKQPFVMSAGRLWDEAKGLAALAACASRVGWPIRVAGATTAPAGIGRVEPRGVELLGELGPAELAAWMGKASIYALPARYEPFGLSVLEAALAGCTLVLGELDTLREVWGNDAVYVPPGDPDALAFALDMLIRDPLRRGALAACARARALALSPRRMALAYRALYDELVATPNQEVCA
ncbi:MAG: glycosyltransferase family 4 protein, partial [Kofleriaceae bacterium]